MKLAEQIYEEEKERFSKNWEDTERILKERILKKSRDETVWPCFKISAPTKYILDFLIKWAESEGFKVRTTGLNYNHILLIWGFESTLQNNVLDLILDSDGKVVKKEVG